MPVKRNSRSTNHTHGNWAIWLRTASSVVGFLVILLGLLFGEVVKYSIVVPTADRKVAISSTIDGMSYWQRFYFKNDGGNFGYVKKVTEEMQDANGRELGLFFADSSKVDGKIEGIVDVQIVAGKTTEVDFKFSQKSLNEIRFESGSVYKLVTTCFYKNRILNFNYLSSQTSIFYFAISDKNVLVVDDKVKKRNLNMEIILVDPSDADSR